jgi:hypothetical protein
MSTNEESFVQSSVEFGGYDPDSIFNGGGDNEIQDDEGTELNKSIIETTNVSDIFGDSQGNFDNHINDEEDNENKRQLGDTKARMEEQLEIDLKQKKIQNEKKEIEDAKARMEQEEEDEQKAFEHQELLELQQQQLKQNQINEENEKQKQKQIQLDKERDIRVAKSRMEQEEEDEQKAFEHQELLDQEAELKQMQLDEAKYIRDAKSRMEQEEEDEQIKFEHQEQLQKEAELKQMIMDEENQIAKAKAFMQQQEQEVLKQKQLDEERDIRVAKSRMEQEEEDEQKAFEHQELLELQQQQLKQMQLDESKQRSEEKQIMEQEDNDESIQISELINNDKDNNEKQKFQFQEQSELGEIDENSYNNVDIRDSLYNANNDENTVRDSLDNSKQLDQSSIGKKNDVRSKMKNMLSSSLTIQRVYRGHIGRKEAFAKQLYNERNKLKLREKKQQETILKLKEIENKQDNIINVDVNEPKKSSEPPPSTYIDDDTGEEILVFKAVRRSKPQLQPNLRISNELLRPDPFPNSTQSSPNRKKSNRYDDEEDYDDNNYENDMLINKSSTPISSPSSPIKNSKLEFPPTNATKQNSRPSQIPSLKLKSPLNKSPNNFSSPQKSKSGLIGADCTPSTLLREGN